MDETESLPLPVLDDMAAALRAEGRYHHSFTEAEIITIVSTEIQRVLTAQLGVRGAPPQMAVRIENGQGSFSGVMDITSPIKVTLKPAAVLANGSLPGTLRLVDFRLDYDGGMMATMAMNAMRPEKQMRSMLSDPNATLNDVLSRQLALRGARVETVWVAFSTDTLDLDLRGGPLEGASSAVPGPSDAEPGGPPS